MQTKIRFGIGRLAMRVAREFIASDEGKEVLSGRDFHSHSLIEYVDRCNDPKYPPGELSAVDVQNVLEIASYQVEFVKEAFDHGASLDVLCEHFAKIRAFRVGHSPAAHPEFAH